MIAMLVTNRGIDDVRVCMEAGALSRGGQRVVVIGWDRDAQDDAYEMHDGVEFLRLAIRSTHGRGLSQPLFMAGYYALAMGALRRMRPTVIHCHDLDTLPLGIMARRLLGGKLVFDAHENYPDMMVGHLPLPAVAAIRRLEKSLVPKCDLLITVGNRLAEHYRQLGARAVEVVGNWKDAGEFTSDPQTVAQTREELGLANGQVAICFVANLGRERHLAPLLEAAAGDARFACIIGGDGPQALMVQNWASEHDNVRYLGKVPPSRVAAVTAACDVVYYGFDANNPNARWSAPNKLYEAIAAGKPVLTGAFGEIGDTVAGTGCGIVADTSSAATLRIALEALADHRLLSEMAGRARAIQGQFSQANANATLQRAYAQIAN